MPSCSPPPAGRRSSAVRSSPSTAARPLRSSFQTFLIPDRRTIMTDLISRTALVTGASRGIGRATARALAASGARVIVHYGNAAGEAEKLVAEIRASGGHADAVGADLSAPDGAQKLAAEVRKLVGDRLDILVANAGIATAATIEDQTVEEFDRMFAVNVRAPFFLVQQLLHQEKRRADVDGKHAVELLDGLVLDGGGGGDARVGDEDIEPVADKFADF